MRIGSFSLSSPNGSRLYTERGAHCPLRTGHSEALVVAETARGKRTHKQPTGSGNRTGGIPLGHCIPQAGFCLEYVFPRIPTQFMYPGQHSRCKG